MRRSSGFIVVVMMVMAVAFTLMVGAFSLFVFLRNQVAMKHVNSVKAYYLASAGAGYGHAVYKTCWTSWISNPDYQPPKPEIFAIQGTVTGLSLKYGRSGNTIKVESVASVNGASRTVICEYTDYNNEYRMDFIPRYKSGYYYNKPQVTRWE